MQSASVLSASCVTVPDGVLHQSLYIRHAVCYTGTKLANLKAQTALVIHRYNHMLSDKAQQACQTCAFRLTCHFQHKLTVV